MWKKKFVDLLYPIDYSKIDIEQALTLKYKNIPTSLFKYKSFDGNGYSIDILQKDEIHLSTPDKFNDPFDCSIIFTKTLVNFYEFLDDFIKPEFGESKTEEIENIFSEIFKSENNEMLSMFNSGLKNDMYITCFSEYKDSILMWSHYADNHRGFCIEYDFSSFDYSDYRTRLLYPVIYTDSIFDATEYFQSGFEEGNTYNNFMITYAAITKSTVWDYEKEWRYVLPLGPSNDSKFLSVPKPKAIYLGAKVSKENKENIIKLATERGMEVYQMAMNPSKFNLIIHKLR